VAILGVPAFAQQSSSSSTTPPAPAVQTIPPARQLVAQTYNGLSIETSQQVFATMCALDAAGFPSDESTLAEMPARLALREDLLKLQGAATQALRKFYHDHAMAEPGETLSRFMAFALVAGPPPTFKFEVPQDLLPPDVLSLQEFQEVLAAFYQEAHLDSRWRQVEREYQDATLRYGLPVNDIVTVSNAYLREVAKPSKGRSFFIYVEPLVGSRTIFRNTGDRYAIVVGLPHEFPTAEVRHAYLHFLLDPLPLQNRTLIQSKAALLNIAARAPHLPPEYESDFNALTDECFIKAVELRLQRLSANQLEAAMTDADRSGFILVRPIVAQLQKFEKDEPAMSYYFSDLIQAIDVQKEQKRAQKIDFYPVDATTGPGEKNVAQNQESDLERRMDLGDREIALQHAPAAEAIFQAVLKQSPNQPRAMYGLAIASVLEGKALAARELFEKVVATAAHGPGPGLETAKLPDASQLAWSHIYLGRIHDLEGERGSAVNEYQAALSVDGAPESARLAAQRGVSVAYAPQVKPGATPPAKP